MFKFLINLFGKSKSNLLDIDTIEVTVLAEDLRTAHYEDQEDCALHRALTRLFPHKEIYVTGIHVTFNKGEKIYKIVQSADLLRAHNKERKEDLIIVLEKISP